jgi:hypothetical protein
MGWVAVESRFALRQKSYQVSGTLRVKVPRRTGVVPSLRPIFVETLAGALGC